MHILILVIAIGQFGSSSQHPNSAITAEFNSKKACEAAIESARAKLGQNARIVLATCEPKSL